MERKGEKEEKEGKCALCEHEVRESFEARLFLFTSSWSKCAGKGCTKVVRDGGGSVVMVPLPSYLQGIVGVDGQGGGRRGQQSVTLPPASVHKRWENGRMGGGTKRQ